MVYLYTNYRQRRIVGDLITTKECLELVMEGLRRRYEKDKAAKQYVTWTTGNLNYSSGTLTISGTITAGASSIGGFTVGGTNFTGISGMSTNTTFTTTTPFYAESNYQSVPESGDKSVAP